MKKIAIDHFSKLKMMSSVNISPDGKNICFVMTEASVEKNTYISHICRYLENGEIKQLTEGGHETDFIFIDNTSLLYKAGGDEVSSTYNKLNLKTGKSCKAFTIPVCAVSVVKCGDEKYAFMGRTYPGYEDMYTGDAKIAKAYLQYRKDNADYEEFDTLPYWLNGGTFTRGISYSIYTYDTKTKKTERITPADFDIREFKVTPDCSKIFVMGDPKKDSSNLILGPSLHCIDMSSGKMSLVKQAGCDLTITDYIPGNDYLIALATDYSCGLTTNGDFYKYTYADKSFTPYAKWDRSIHSSVYCDVKLLGGRQLKLENDVFYFTSTVDEEHPLFKCENGKIERIFEDEGDVVCFDVHEGKVIAAALFDMKPMELYCGCGKQLTKVNTAAMRGKYVAKPERLNIISHGREIRGFIYKPIDYDEKKKYPTILFIHGGPKSDLGPVYFNIFQYWTGIGYMVICCDPFGSDGRGSEFADMRGMYGKDDYEDFMNFCDAAIAKYPQIDTKNFFETGISYGGFMTNWIIGHTDRFTACVSQAPVTSWISMSLSDIGAGFGYNQCGGTVWGDFDKVWDASPLKYADKCKTPTMFIHAINDYRCPLPESLQMYAALKEYGVETKCFLIRGESHALFEIGQPKHRIRYVEEITKWFEEHKQ